MRYVSKHKFFLNVPIQLKSVLKLGITLQCRYITYTTAVEMLYKQQLIPSQ